MITKWLSQGDIDGFFGLFVAGTVLPGAALSIGLREPARQ